MKMLVSVLPIALLAAACGGTTSPAASSSIQAASSPPAVTAVTAVAGTAGEASTGVAVGATETTGAEPDPPTTVAAQAKPKPKPKPKRVTLSGTFDRISEPIDGTATFTGTAGRPGKLALTSFGTAGGPALHVYLTGARPDADPSTFDDDAIDLGPLKSESGDQTYEVAASVKIGKYRTVVVWCDDFNVAFGAARLR